MKCILVAARILDSFLSCVLFSSSSTRHPNDSFPSNFPLIYKQRNRRDRVSIISGTMDIFIYREEKYFSLDLSESLGPITSLSQGGRNRYHPLRVILEGKFRRVRPPRRYKDDIVSDANLSKDNLPLNGGGGGGGTRA